MNVTFYQVGGSLRDEFLGVKSKDIDYAVEAPSFTAMREAIVERGGKIFLETPQYLTIRAMVPDLGAADFVLCRKDSAYRDGRHPDSVEIGTIFDDLARRDFTMNAMARNVLTNKLIDPHCGYEDICSRVVRCVGNPVDRFNEDKLRILRALRFVATKKMNLLWHTSEAILKFPLDSFAVVSTERIREELLKMFAADSEWAFHQLFVHFPVLGDLALQRGIWFKPTLESV